MSASTGVSSTPVTLTMGGDEGGQNLSQMRAHVHVINDPGAKDEAKLHAAQQISDNLDMILSSPEYPSFLQQSLGVFRKFLREMLISGVGGCNVNFDFVIHGR